MYYSGTSQDVFVFGRASQYGAKSQICNFRMVIFGNFYAKRHPNNLRNVNKLGSVLMIIYIDIVSLFFNKNNWIYFPITTVYHWPFRTSGWRVEGGEFQTTTVYFVAQFNFHIFGYNTLAELHFNWSVKVGKQEAVTPLNTAQRLGPRGSPWALSLQVGLFSAVQSQGRLWYGPVPSGVFLHHFDCRRLRR